MNMCFILKNIGRVVLQQVFRQWTYNNEVCVKWSSFNEFGIDYYGKLEKVIELQYHNKHNTKFVFKCYWYNTTDRGIRVDLHHGLVEINDLEENLIFYITKNIFVDIDVDADELNGVLSSNAHTEVDEDNNDKINVEDCDGDKDESIDEEEDNSD